MIKTRQMVVTPAIAAKWLESRNTHNRPLDEVRANHYADDIKNDRWNEDSVVKFSTENILMDGQTRVRAVVLADKPAVFCVMEGVPPENQYTMDTGRPRTDSQQVALKYNKKNATTFTTSIATIRKLLGLDHYRGNMSGLDETIAEFGPSVDQIIANIGKIGRKAGVVSALAIARTKHGYAKLVDQFVLQLASGANLSSGDPALALRSYLIENRGRSTGGHTGDKTAFKTLTAFNKFADGLKISHLKIDLTAVKKFGVKVSANADQP